jgi:hypothetical protein
MALTLRLTITVNRRDGCFPRPWRSCRPYRAVTYFRANTTTAAKNKKRLTHLVATAGDTISFVPFESWLGSMEC